MHVRRGLAGRVQHRPGRRRRPVQGACLHGVRRKRQALRHRRIAERGEGVRQRRKFRRQVGSRLYGRRKLGRPRRRRSRVRRLGICSRAVRQQGAEDDPGRRKRCSVGAKRADGAGPVQPALGRDGGLRRQRFTSPTGATTACRSFTPDGEFIAAFRRIGRWGRPIPQAQFSRG